MQVSILVGTMTGTAELVAGDIKKALEGKGHAVEILLMDNLKSDVFQRPGAFLICTSTYGQGDVPDNARDFLADLRTARPDLTGKLVGIVGLGDSTYQDTFNHGGRQFEETLASLNASLVGERMQHNASGGSLPEEDGVAWALDWVEQVEPLAQAA
ncbi:MAG TPA: flavodoxin domain-containing protein [Ferrovibrio sp.]|jgi:MioC protein|uniref:flavodoxin domain-containing protein n=1 Tax=Ferrovibrio sp. TaxID=1917215 RepID=UPI002B4B2D95|nr:flavodoxin domain-containing protein [Ferrovibrio sp.]HLT78569.1 flavodoxin domain-containing protein [Ferrovibrio sp.]